MNVRAIGLVREDCARVLEGEVQRLAPLKGETVVVTGGTGFVGTWLAELIATLNDEHAFGVSAILISRSTDHFRATRPHLAQRKDFRLVKSDVRHTVELPKETNWLVHAAANPDGRFHSTSPVEAMSIITDGTSSLLRAVDRCSQFKMFLNLSSSLIYGPQPWELEKVPETFGGAPSCASVSSAYAEAKRCAETLCAAARSQARIPLMTARPFAFIGPYQSMETPWAINSFIREAMAGSAIRVSGDGQTVRSYMYPSELAFWLLRMLTGGTSGASYNVGSEEGVTLESLATLISNQFSPRPEIRLRTAGGSVPRSRMVPDVGLAQRTLGLSQKVTLKTAVERTILWNKSL